MSRASRVPYHQNVYDLLLIEPSTIAGADAPIREWESRTGLRFPAALTELYTTEATIPCGVNAQDEWKLPLVDVWYQYSNMEQPTALDRVLDQRDRPDRVQGKVDAGPYCLVQVENQGCWLLYARLTGEDDPPTHATDGGPFFYRDGEEWTSTAWKPLGHFSELLFTWIKWFYFNLEIDGEVDESWVPIRFMGHSDEHLASLAPPKPYANGHWLRSRDEPFQPPVIDFLIEQFGEPERTARPGDVTTYTFRPAGGTVRVTADEPALTGALSAWWVHADTPDRLAEFARLLMPWGTFRDTLRADTDAARGVLNQLKGERPV